MASDQLHNLDLAAERGDAEAAALAVRNFLSTSFSPGELATVGDKVQALVERFRGSRENAKLAPALLTSSEVLHAQDEPRQALRQAEEAKELFRSLGPAGIKGIASCLEAMFQVHHSEMNHLAGLKAINQQLDAFRTSGHARGEVAVLETLGNAHGAIGEPYSAVKAYEQALEIYKRLGDKQGQGSSLHSKAEMLRATGGHPEHAQALVAARQSAALFREAKCSWGEEKAQATVSSLLVEAGQMEKAPNRPEAVRALKQLAQAVEQKQVSEAQAAQAKLSGMRDCVTDSDILEHLGPVATKDPTATKFLNEELGWEMNEKSASSAESELGGSHIVAYSHKLFYLNTLFGGMGFGPQFRSVHPFRHGRNKDYTGCCVAVLPETEAWQNELSYRPGIIDASMQSCALFGYGPDPL